MSLARATAAALALLAGAPLAAQDWRRPLEGYVDWPSARAGTALALHVSSRAPSFDVRVVREGEEATLWERHGLPGAEQSVPEGAPATDCAWPVACSIPIGAEWPSGIYWACLAAPEDKAASFELPFVVRSVAGAGRTLALIPECTAQAYNAWGGASLYPSSYGPPQPVVNLRRPHNPAFTGHLRGQTEPGFDTWLRARGLVVEWAADTDLQREPDLLEHVDLLLLPGHHEYWSAEMRARLDAFVGNGGRLLVLGANTLYWQIRFEQDGTAIRCHKQPRRDALAATQPSAVTSTWLGEPVLDAQDRTLGMAWQHACWSAPLGEMHDAIKWSLGVGPATYRTADGFGCWRVVAPSQPDLAALSLPRGALFGAGTAATDAGPQPLGLCGGEVDGALTEEIDGARPASSALGAPRNLLVLADAPSQEGLSAIASFERMGEVLWVSSERVLTGLTEPRLAVPGLAEFTEAAVRRLSRPRRNRLVNAGFETWEGRAPRGWTLKGFAQRVERDVTGTGSMAAELLTDSVLSQKVYGLLPEDECLLLVHVVAGKDGLRGKLLDSRGETLATARPLGDGRLLAAWMPAGGATGDERVVLEKSGRGQALVDAVELLDSSALAAESLPLAGDAPGSLTSTPVPGGGRLLALAAAPGLAELRALDADSGRELGRVHATAGVEQVMLVFDDRARGRMLRLALQARDADGRGLALSQALLLPLRLPSPAVPIGLRSAGFERPGGLDGWSPAGVRAAQITPVAPLVGQSCLHVETGDAEVRVTQSVMLGADPGPLVLTAWVRGTGEVGLALGMAGGTVSSTMVAAGPEWRALRVFADKLPEVGSAGLALSLRPGASVEFDAVSLRYGTDLLVDDLYPNGGFEITPSEAEIARGADWTGHVPRWAALRGAPPRLDDARAHSGRRSLRLEAGASAVTRLGWPLPADSAALAGVHVWAAAPGAVTLRLLVGEAAAAEPSEVARWTNASLGAWEDALLCVPRGGARGTPLDAWLVVEAGEGGAWLDDLGFSGAE